jgi:hypothetical protein
VHNNDNIADQGQSPSSVFNDQQSTLNDQPPQATLNVSPSPSPTNDDQRTTNNVPKRRGGGPKTVAGKRRSSQNALKTGLYSTRLLLSNEDHEQFQGLVREVYSTLRPRDVIESMLAYQVALNYWNALRFSVIEAAELTASAEDTREIVEAEWLNPDAGIRNAYAFRAAHSVVDLANRNHTRYSRKFHQAIGRYYQIRNNPLPSQDDDNRNGGSALSGFAAEAAAAAAAADNPNRTASSRKTTKRTAVTPFPATNTSDQPPTSSAFFQSFMNSGASTPAAARSGVSPSPCGAGSQPAAGSKPAPSTTPTEQPTPPQPPKTVETNSPNPFRINKPTDQPSPSPSGAGSQPCSQPVADSKPASSPDTHKRTALTSAESTSPLSLPPAPAPTPPKTATATAHSAFSFDLTPSALCSSGYRPTTPTRSQ